MRWARKIQLRARSLFRKSEVDAELSEELQFHLEHEAAKNEAAGMSKEDARRAAAVEFGGAEQVKEECRDMRRVNLAQDFAQDLRYGLRTLRKSPGFSATAIVTLALGIGANTAIFSVIDAVLLRPLPYRQPDRLVTVFESNMPNDFSTRNAAAPGNFLDWRSRTHVFEQIGAVSLNGFNITKTDRPERVTGAAISAGMLEMLGLRPALGRDIEPQDDREGADRVVVLGYSRWQRQFGGDPKIVGKTIHLGTIPHTVIGVLPPGLTFPEQTVELWVPLEQTIDAKSMHWRDSHYFDVFARLKPGVSMEQARAEMNGIAAALKGENPDTNSGSGTYIIPVKTALVGDIRPALLTLFVAVAFVLFIACANVANLLLVRATGREKELSIRVALGAGTSRLIRQMLTESTLLSLAGGGAGVLVAGWISRMLLALRPVSLPRYNTIEIDSRVLLFTFGVSVVTGLVFGLAPAIRAVAFNGNLTWSGSSRGATSGAKAQLLRNILVGGEIAISLVLLIGAGLLIRSFVRLSGKNLGFRVGHVVTVRVSIPQDKYPQESQVRRFYDELLSRVRAIPGVEGAGSTSFLPLTGTNFDNSFDIAGQPKHPPSNSVFALVRFIDPTYLSVMKIPILQGRGIEERDREGAPRAILISESMAKRYWEDVSPLGQHLIVYMGKDQSPWEIVGVVPDVNSDVTEAPRPTMYFPYAQFPYRFMVLTVRTRQDANAMIESIRQATRTLDPDQPLSQIRTLDQLLSETLLPWRFSMTLLGSFAALALLLAAAGIYGVISYAVGKRRNEIGIRMALGAQPKDVVRMVIRHGASIAFIGIAVGLAGAFYLTRFMTSQLYAVPPTDPLTYIAIALLLGAVALVASYIPARRAKHVDPVVALRYE